MSERHGLKNHKLYGVWCTMHSRCYNLNSDKYKNYGGVGIKVCAAWHSFIEFYNWAVNSGYREGLSLGRLHNNEDYTPQNCGWETQKTQQRNRTNNVSITAFGETKLRVEWIEDPRCKVSFHTLRRRLSRGWTPEDAISKPLQN